MTWALSGLFSGMFAKQDGPAAASEACRAELEMGELPVRGTASAKEAGGEGRGMDGYVSDVSSGGAWSERDLDGSTAKSGGRWGEGRMDGADSGASAETADSRSVDDGGPTRVKSRQLVRRRGRRGRDCILQSTPSSVALPLP